MDHHQTDNGAEEDISAENSRRGDRNDNRQIRKCGVRSHIQECEPVGVAKAEARDLRQRFDQTHHKTGCNDRRQDRNEYVADGLEQTDVPGLLCSSCRLDVFLGSSGRACDCQELVIDLVDGAGANDQLQLSVGFEHALDAVDVLECFLVDLAVVSDDKAQSGSAVCC